MGFSFLFPIPYSLFPVPCSLFLVPCSLKSGTLYLTKLKTAILQLKGSVDKNLY
ncbi:MAG: hypothetical protein F6J98_04105 [Moorea sp. SIO4G2]|nr:hypothetical protein [Moorena sp. SIO4G2]